MDISIFGAALAGLISFLSPCVLPLVLPYLGYLGGTTIDQMAGTDGKSVDPKIYRRVVISSLFFVAGFTTVFAALGAAASVFGQFIAQYRDTMAIVAGIFILIFGLHFLGVIRIPLLYRDTRYQSAANPASFVGAYFMGLAFAFGWTPCVGPVLATILTFAANDGTLYKGVGLLLVYSLGLGIPFIMAAVAIRPFMGFMQRFRKHMGTVEKVMGVLLVITGILFITGSMSVISFWLLEYMPFLGSIG
jgi:cytochrome c-type biogenesis protein